MEEKLLSQVKAVLNDKNRANMRVSNLGFLNLNSLNCKYPHIYKVVT